MTTKNAVWPQADNGHRPELVDAKGNTFSWELPEVDARDAKIAHLESQLNRAIQALNAKAPVQAQVQPEQVQPEKTLRQRIPDSKAYYVIRKGVGSWEVKKDLRGLASKTLRRMAALYTGLEFREGVTRYDCYEAISDGKKANRRPGFYVAEHGKIKDGLGLRPQVENPKTVKRITARAKAQPRVAGGEMARMGQAFTQFMEQQQKAFQAFMVQQQA